MEKTKLLLSDDILTAVRNFCMHKRLAISEVIKVIILLLANPWSKASGMRSFSTARRVKTWLCLTMTQQRFNNVSILNNHEVETDNLDLLAIAGAATLVASLETNYSHENCDKLYVE